jgi:hypothetical protein
LARISMLKLNKEVLGNYKSTSKDELFILPKCM